MYLILVPYDPFQIAERARLAAMTEEERQAHFKEKQRQHSKARNEALKAKRALEGKKDDLEFKDATPLPTPSPVSLRVGGRY